MNRQTESFRTVLFADVCESTRLYERLGDQTALAALARCLACMRRATEQFGGRVVKTIGDETMSAFERVEDAFQAAYRMQQMVDELPGQNGVKLAIRIGFHCGPVIEEASDLFGDTVNTAARLANLAKAGQILLSGAVLAHLPQMQQGMTRDLDRLTIKGKGEDLALHEVIWQHPEELTMKLATLAPEPVLAVCLHLRYRGRDYRLDGRHSVLTLGRDTGNDVVLEDALASRSHARIERRRERFVLIDQSTNGTYVTVSGEPEVAVRREEILLRGPGFMAFGDPRLPARDQMAFCFD